MLERSGDDSTVVSESAAVIAGLEGRLDEVTDVVVQHLLAEIAELRGETQLLELLRASAERNIDTVFSAIHHNIPIEHVEPPTAALEHARRLAQRGVPANALARAYRLGQQTMLDLVLNEVQLADLDPRRSLAVFRQLTSITFKYIDRISQQVIAAYETERDRWLETQNSTRALRVRELLDTETADVDAVSLAIEYPLHRWHLAVVVWCPDTDQDDELVRMERLVRGLGETLGSQGRPLFVAADRVTGWAWIPLTVNSARDAVSRTRRFAEADKQAPSLAIGDPLPGVDGFRRSHRQALGAHAVALAAGPDAQRILANNDSGLSAAALLADKLDVARIWVAEVLGPLACDTEADERLRETVRVFLRAGSSYKAAAAELNLHFNSVKYRIQRAEERRGRPISNDRLEVEFALLLCHWLRAAVLRAL
ncbi:ABC transporter substrate-binding protein [Mycolicibacter terrae]|uniref:ABC transporter substrate-binding protein n=1 Tax=Mycolicibacter terrae TaxID=1788 RepID=A0AAD1HT12_9MYCO|nr:helix-turn-helix domain-containing protein [Mycolicibacter terrae]ORW90592.1 PucR family transcriptional regulator [Mycolicibacter terrae]BBX20933.1 ABC transporter substrate-binding protein [Mycolicibacter terrae]SNV92924.1 putative regulatory protein [Mycolicibacter terrae]